MVVTPKNVGYYGYDASGERVYKLTGYTNVSRTNASRPEYGMDFVDITVYPSPYIVLSDKGYTKHFYAGTERIATLLGEGGLPFQYSADDEIHHMIIRMGFEDMMAGIEVCPKPPKVTNEDICHKEHEELQYECSPLCCTLFGTDAPYGGFAKLLETWSDSPTQVVNNVYFTHSNHLGSASWITDNSGKPIQYIHYAPYGDLVANQRLGGYDERFKFTSKERDEESGYDYFGARYYTPPLGIWLSVDPLADKYPHVTSYLYCNGNPIMLVNPDGGGDCDSRFGWKTNDI